MAEELAHRAVLIRAAIRKWRSQMMGVMYTLWLTWLRRRKARKARYRWATAHYHRVLRRRCKAQWFARIKEIQARRAELERSLLRVVKHQHILRLVRAHGVPVPDLHRDAGNQLSKLDAFRRKWPSSVVMSCVDGRGYS